MSEPTRESPDQAENPKARPPLGLPTGSVRALLTLLILAVVIVETMRGHQLDELWNETLLISLAHYFTSRRFIGLSPALLRRLEVEGHVPQESNPLYLPRHSIRTLIVLSFAGLGWYAYEVQGVRDFSQIPPVLITVTSYLLGVFARGLFTWGRGSSPAQPPRLWEDLKAVAVILILLGAAIPYFLDQPELLNHQARSVALACVLFYFGSR
jgi:hypothetical protein